MEDKKNLLTDIYVALLKAGIVENKKDFANKLAINVSSLSSAFGGNKNYLNDNLFKKIYDTFPQLPTLLQNNTIHIAQIMHGDNNGVSGSNIKDSKVAVSNNNDAVLQERIKGLENEIALLKQRLTDKDEMIELLRNK